MKSILKMEIHKEDLEKVLSTNDRNKKDLLDIYIKKGLKEHLEIENL